MDVDGLHRETARVHATGIELVARGADPGDQFAVMEDRRHGGEVGGVDGAEIGVVADEDVAILEPAVPFGAVDRRLDD